MPGVQSSAAALLSKVEALRDAVRGEADDLFRGWQGSIRRPDFAADAHNLACYLALRRRELRALQQELAPFGLSTLGRLEGRVLCNLDAVIRALRALAGCPPDDRAELDLEAYASGERQLRSATDLLFGPASDDRRGRLMVTLPSDAGDNPDFLRACIANGMDVARINCAHDDELVWAAMVAAVRTLARLEGRNVRILMDIAGPKSRIEAVKFNHDRERVHAGDRILVVHARFRPGREWPAQVRIGIPEALAALAAGADVWFDDGKLGCVVERRDGDDLVLRVEHARAKGVRLRPGKGVNFPHTDLLIPALTDKDRKDLAFAANHADMIGYSFVQSDDDVDLLQSELARHRPNDWKRIGIVAKIETLRGVRKLPEIIVAAAGCQPFGVMVARGDLAVELGFERLAEMQEELLWICEAARIPVIWATQVLEDYVKTGLPSRGEMTDAAMGVRAECVMLNKGPHTVEALQLLGRLMRRMSEHQTKKTSRLRALHSW